MIYSLCSRNTRLGRLCAVADSEGVVASFWEDSPPPLLRRLTVEETVNEICDKWLANIDNYLEGGPLVCEVPYKMIGTEFQISVWKATRAIPLGETRTYGEIAHMISKPTAFRAVAQALGANPIGIVVPCHRVVSANGTGGFSGGINRKYSLLSLELSGPTLHELGFHEEIH